MLHLYQRQAGGFALLFDDLKAAHVGAEHLGDGDAAVGVLVVFHDGNHGAWDTEA